jgi:hypothetical protein
MSHDSPTPVPDMRMTALEGAQKKTDFIKLRTDQTSVQKVLSSFCRLAETVNTLNIKA